MDETVARVYTYSIQVDIQSAAGCVCWVGIHPAYNPRGGSSYETRFYPEHPPVPADSQLGTGLATATCHPWGLIDRSIYICRENGF